MAEKLIEESKAQRWKDMESTKGKVNTSTHGGGAGNRVLVAHMDSNGKAFISYVDPSMLYSSLDATAYVNLASINTDVMLSTEDLEHCAFPIMHHIDVMGAYVYGNMPGGIEPLPAWMTINSDITSSLDWNAYSHPTDLTTVSTNAPNQALHTIASSNEFPFSAL